MHIIFVIVVEKKAKDTSNILSIVHMKGVTNMELNHIVSNVSPNEKLRGHLHKVICELLEEIEKIADNLPKRPSTDSLLALSETPLSLKLTHRYGLLFLGKPVDLLIDMYGIGKACVSLGVGWNQLDMGEGTAIALASGGSLSALYRCTDTLDLG